MAALTGLAAWTPIRHRIRETRYVETGLGRNPGHASSEKVADHLGPSCRHPGRGFLVQLSSAMYGSAYRAVGQWLGVVHAVFHRRQGTQVSKYSLQIVVGHASE